MMTQAVMDAGRAKSDSDQRANNRLEELLDAAADLFAAKGFKETTMRDIAASVAMLPGSIYYHFPSKEDLLAAVYQEGVRRVTERVAEAAAERDDPWLRLEDVMAAHLETILDQSAYARVMIRVLPDNVPKIADRLVALRDAYEQRLVEVIEGLPIGGEVDRKLLRFFLLGAANHAEAWYRAGDRTPREIASHLVRMLRFDIAA